MGTEISFRVSPADGASIRRIIDRAVGMGIVEDRMSSTMDITACHANGTPLDLERFADADRFNFLHDFYGIARHLDRSTGQLDGRFLPRFHRREIAA